MGFYKPPTPNVEPPPPSQPYIVWHDMFTEGWQRSEDLDTLEDVYTYIATNTYGHPHVITKAVKVKHIDLEEAS